LRGCSVLLCQLELPLALTEKALQVAHEEGVTTVLNTAPAPDPTSPLHSTLNALVNVWCANEPELEQLTGMPVDTLEAVESAARSLVAKGARCVLVTLGSRGALLCDEKQKVSCFPVPEAVQVKDTSGAGDCFLGAFAYYLDRGMDLTDCVQRAIRVASLSVQALGTQSSYPSRETLAKLDLL